jgi:serine/threonine protein kinase
MIDVQIPGYRVLSTLGVGGMATVYLAEQQSLEREVALKVMAPTLAANADFCEQFLKEGRITAKLTHPNLVTVHDIGTHRGIYYMASEFLPAGSLRERLQGGLRVAEALAIARDVASGLNYAHEMGFVHRDVKPGNILFRANGSAVLADFGIAKAMKSISTATMAGNAIGTPDYMSPEQAQATSVDGRTDLYSLGAVLFEMLSGRRPYVASDPYAVALRHVTDAVPTLPEPLAWLQPLIDSAMAKDRELRYPTGEAFIAACDALLADHPQIARESRDNGRRGAPRPLPRRAADDNAEAPPAGGPFTRTRWIAAGAVAFIVIVAGAVGWRSWHASPLTSAPPIAPINPTPARPNPPAAPDVPGYPTDPLSAAGLDRLATPALLARAAKYLEEGLNSDDARHLSFPDGDNAIDLFREMLKRDPGNAVAADGLTRIARYYARGAQRTFDRGLDTFTQELVEKGLRAKPDDSALLKLKNDLAARAASGN